MGPFLLFVFRLRNKRIRGIWIKGHIFWRRNTLGGGIPRPAHRKPGPYRATSHAQQAAHDFLAKPFPKEERLF